MINYYEICNTNISIYYIKMFDDHKLVHDRPLTPHLQSEQYHPVHSVYSASGGASAGHSHLCSLLCKGQEEER